MRRTSVIVLAMVAVVACRPQPREATIVATDYAYRAPESLPPGPTLFRFVNSGAHLHEVQIFRFNHGMSVEAANRWLATGIVPDSAGDAYGAVLIAPSRVEATERVWADLKPGELYALMCQFRDTTGAQMHSKMGMVKLLQVK